MTLHVNLTGADLHEPKGAESASTGTVYVSDGAGSGSWTKIGTAEIDTAEVFNVNKGKLSVYFADIGTAGSIYIPWSSDVTITKITTAVHTAPTTTDTVLTCYNGTGVSMGTITVAFGGSAGDLDSLTPASNNTLTANQVMRIASDGGAANTVAVTIVIDYTWTS